MKLTKKQIDIIVENTPQELRGYHTSFDCDLGYFAPTGANWAYLAGYVRHGDGMVLVAKLHGKIM